MFSVPATLAERVIYEAPQLFGTEPSEILLPGETKSITLKSPSVTRCELAVIGSGEGGCDIGLGRGGGRPRAGFWLLFRTA